MVAHPARPQEKQGKWHPSVFYGLFVYIGICLWALFEIPNALFSPELRHITFFIGTIGIWRYGWWFTHFIRAETYKRRCYPALSSQAAACWQRGWRPPHVHFLMVTFKEDPETTKRVLESIFYNAWKTATPATLWVGTGHASDEDIITRYIQSRWPETPVNIHFVRQNVPGKRMALTLCLRAMIRNGLSPAELVIFMDGDSILAPDTLEKCTPLFETNPHMHALTTDEEVICHGPDWIGRWLSMRFAQRRIAMQSYALSRRVLTLTGRMSMFRGAYVMRRDFIQLLENDYLTHWLWGRFRFLSGDDKTTWYYLLSKGAQMLYVPDVTVYTVEHIQGSGIKRMSDNFRRWSGNMLRNGTRAIALGPRRMPFFIWWCLIDQRISMWTSLIAPISALLASVHYSWAFMVGFLIWIALTRLFMSILLWIYAPKVDFSWPFILYINQLLNAVVKIYTLFHLSQQRWVNRGNQSSGVFQFSWQRGMALYLTLFYVAALVCILLLITQAWVMPGASTFKALWGL